RQSRGTLIGLMLACALLAFAPANSHAQQPAHVSGSVKDSSGAAVAAARVTIHSAHKTQTVDTDSAGKFEFTDLPDLTGTLEVTVRGFASATQNWSLTTGVAVVDFVLRPSTDGERVVVSASRTEMKLVDVPGSVIELLPTDIEANPALTLDDALREVPGFTL